MWLQDDYVPACADEPCRDGRMPIECSRVNLGNDGDVSYMQINEEGYLGALVRLLQGDLYYLMNQARWPLDEPFRVVSSPHITVDRVAAWVSTPRQPLPAPRAPHYVVSGTIGNSVLAAHRPHTLCRQYQECACVHLYTQVS